MTRKILVKYSWYEKWYCGISKCRDSFHFSKLKNHELISNFAEMKYEVGDTVLLLHSQEEGKIVEIMNENMVMVNVGGIEFPVFTDQIDFPYFKRFSEASQKKKTETKDRKIYIDQIPKEKQTIRKTFESGVHFIFVPVYDTSLYEDNIDHFKLYISNQNNEAYHFEYCVLYKENPDFVITNEIRGQSDFYLHNITQEALNDIIKFQFHFSLAQPDKKRVPQVEHSLKVKAKTLFFKIEEMQINNVPSFGFEIFKRYPDKPPEDYISIPVTKINYARPGAPREQPHTVIDLHIEKILDNHYGLSNFEILQFQLNYFEKYYRLAVDNMQPKLIVIHGVGSGKLRDEIHEILRGKKEVKSFVNQYHPNFGFGATEIYFQY